MLLTAFGATVFEPDLKMTKIPSSKYDSANYIAFAMKVSTMWAMKKDSCFVVSEQRHLCNNLNNPSGN